MLTKEKKIILIGFAAIALVVGPCIVVNIIRFTRFEEHDPASTTLHKVHSISREDSSLLSPSALAQIKLGFCWENAYRHVSYLFFNRQYELEITSDALANYAPLPEITHLTEKWSGEMDLDIHTPVKLQGQGEFDFRLASAEPVQDIYITYYGEKIDTIVSNDSLLQYRLICKDLSIRHAIDSLADFGLTNGGDKFGPTMNVDFIVSKHQSKVYFLFFTPINFGEPIEPIVANQILRK